MNTPPEQIKEEIVQYMGSYLFMVIAQLDAFTNETGSLPVSEEALNQMEITIDCK